MVDVHCHILPGVDDGPREMEAAVAMARVAERDGIRAIVATPHVDPRKGFPTPEAIRERTAALNEALRQEGIDLTVLPGAENQLSDDLAEQIKDGKVMTLADRGKHVLIELPFSGYPTFVGELFFDIQLLGVTPVLAHPERAAIAHADPDEIRALADRGAILQINADSMTGREGRAVRAFAHRLVREKLAQIIATDAHDPKRRAPRLTPARKAFRRLGGEAAFRKATEIEPGRLIGEARGPVAGERQVMSDE